MADFEKCSGDLRRLIGIAQEVQRVVQTHRDAASSGDQRDFAEVVNDYIEKLMRSFE